MSDLVVTDWDIPPNRSNIPERCSVGTDQFCIGFRFQRDVFCHHLPFRFTSMELHTGRIGTNFNSAQKLDAALMQLTFNSIKGSLVTGLVIAVCFTALSIRLVCQWWFMIPTYEHRAYRWCFSFLAGNENMVLRTVVVFLSGIVCCTPLIIPSLVLLSVKSQLTELLLPGWIKVEFGQVLPLCLAAVSCFMTAVALASGSQVYIV